MIKALLIAIFKALLERPPNGARNILHKIAQSDRLTSNVIVLGYLSLALLSAPVALLIFRIHDAMLASEERAEIVAREFSQWISEISVQLNNVDSWLKEHKPTGLEPISEGERRNLRRSFQGIGLESLTLIHPTGETTVLCDHQRLDKEGSPEWHKVRWQNIRSIIDTSVNQFLDGPSGEPGKFTVNHEGLLVYAGIERIYQSKANLAGGKPLSGSVVFSKIYPREDGRSWIAVVGAFPVARAPRIAPNLRVDTSHYQNGNYDYLIEEEGDILFHPRAEHVAGSTANGAMVPSARSAAEIDTRPVNTRNSEFIPGYPVLNETLRKSLSDQPSTVAYKNLQNKLRLTTFRRIDIPQPSAGHRLVVVSGHGLGMAESLIAPIVGGGVTAPWIVVIAISSALISAFMAWSWVTGRLRELQLDYVAWSKHARPSLAKDLGLIGRRIKDTQVSLPDMAVVLISLHPVDIKPTEAHTVSKAEALLREHLKHQGWLVKYYSPFGFVLIRKADLIVGKVPSNAGETRWTPEQVVVQLRAINEFRELLTSVKILAMFAHGDVQIERAERSPDGDAVLELKSDALDSALAMNIVSEMEQDRLRSGLLYGEDVPLAMAGSQIVLGSKTMLFIPFVN